MGTKLSASARGWPGDGLWRGSPRYPRCARRLPREDAAVYGYGVAGAHLSGSRQAAAQQDWEGHNQARDTLTAMIYALGAQPVAAQAFYALPFPVHDGTSAMALAVYLEDGVTRAYLGIVAVSDQRLRDFGALAMQSSAERAAYWRGSTQAFPGLDPKDR